MCLLPSFFSIISPQPQAGICDILCWNLRHYTRTGDKGHSLGNDTIVSQLMSLRNSQSRATTYLRPHIYLASVPLVLSFLCQLNLILTCNFMYPGDLCFVLSCACLFCDPMESSLLGNSIYGIFLAIILEWFAFYLLQRIFPNQELNSHLLHCRQILNPQSHWGRHMYPGTPNQKFLFEDSFSSTMQSPKDFI